MICYFSEFLVVRYLVLFQICSFWQECFYEKDYLNYRYHAKRFLYLCKIKEQLTKSPLIKAVRWSSFQNEARKPILLVYPGRVKLSSIPSLASLWAKFSGVYCKFQMFIWLDVLLLLKLLSLLEMLNLLWG